MRILFCSENFWPYIGGVEVLAAKLLPALRKMGHDFIVVTTHDYLNLPDETWFKDIPIYRFPLLSALAHSNIDQLMKIRHRVANLKRDFAPDLIHMNSVGLNALFHLQTVKACPVPLLVTLHQNLPDAFRANTIQERTLGLANWVACCSDALLSDAQRLLPEIVTCSSVIRNGFEMPAIPPAPLPTDGPRLLCVGRLVPEKGFDLALSALASLVGRFPRARMIIAGDGPLRLALERQAAEMGISGAVSFAGWVSPDEMPELMNSASVIVMPSRREGLPLVALEAAWMARPVVATRVGGIPEIVVDRQTGLLVEKENIKALTEMIELLLDQPENAADLGLAARCRVQEVFNFECYVNAYDVLYKKLVIGVAREISTSV
jgi:glycogen synthase